MNLSKNVTINEPNKSNKQIYKPPSKANEGSVEAASLDIFIIMSVDPKSPPTTKLIV
jgi:hypothetical protein